MDNNQTPKQTTTLGNGIIIGAGAAMLVTGLLITLTLNSIYNQQVSYLTKYGIEVNTYAYGFDNLFSLISTGVLIALLGIYMLVFGCLNHFSAKVRAAFAIRNSMTKIGNALITFGFSWSTLLSSQIVWHFYRPISSSWYFPFSIAAIIGGIIVMAMGFFLIKQAYINNQSITTLTLERKNPPPPPSDDTPTERAVGQ
jgi:predicted cation transporter